MFYSVISGVIMEQKFGEFIKEKRVQRGYKLKVFSELVGISSVYESYIENGKRPAPAERILNNMIRVLGLDDAEIHRLHHLASATRSKYDLPDDIAEYLTDREYLYDLIRMAKEKELSQEQWIALLDRIESSDRL